MAEALATPQDAEDAFYDAIEEGDAEALRRVWEDSDDIACLFPMQPLRHGAEVHEVFRALAEGRIRFDIQVRHIRWLDPDDLGGALAIHWVEERVGIPGEPPQPPIYAMNIYRKAEAGWRLLVHQNSPTPPPPGSMPASGAAAER